MKAESKIMTKKIIMAIVGIALTSIAVACTKISGFGVDPFSVLMFGISNVTGLSYQVVFISSCALLTVVAWKLNRTLLGLATVISLTCSGTIVDVAYGILKHMIGTPGAALRFLMMVIGLALISVSSALYYTANLGVSPYDAQALTIAAKTSVPFKFSRVATDIVCAMIGFVLGGDLGIGTVIIAFCMGPFIQVCREKISDPILAGDFMNHINIGGRFTRA